ncbi:Detected protein of unknown function [Hibiscus syriacus]|uniref:Uncharacterized protein n=1 Tax=Hibiscus syriacus TaxID=106335 RepID=A0A6A2WY46_HIBSY|nr:Detected protein of unknown function [Hibiscus syriacus]
MTNASTDPERKKKVTRYPPRRGRVKAHIFESIVKTVACAVSRAKEAMAKNKGESSDGKSSSSGTSTLYLKEMSRCLRKQPTISWLK